MKGTAFTSLVKSLRDAALILLPMIIVALQSPEVERALEGVSPLTRAIVLSAGFIIRFAYDYVKHKLDEFDFPEAEDR